MKAKKSITVYNEKQSFKNTPISNFYISYYKDRVRQINRIDNHRHTYYEVIWVKDGKGLHTIDFKDYQFCGSCLFLLHPKNVHRIYKETPASGGVIKFNDHFFVNDNVHSKFLLQYGVFDDIDVLPVIHLNTEEQQTINDFFEIMSKEAFHHNAFTPPILLNLLKSFLLKVYQIKKNQCAINDISDHRFVKFRQFQELLEAYLTEHHNAGFYAEKLQISTKTLSNYCKLISSKTAQDLIKERLILEAKRMLIYSELSVKEVAYHLGFNDYAYFTRFFTVNVSLTPTDFKKAKTEFL
ncbi:helix-turn-helix domain-containing protein [Chryseobacterium sp. JV558]|uniref:helix-turn-helix domain-containing protein n=1 Tax=Chryseobacterium sp. JV558 TaxID=2663236 RepID=UPI00299DC700|nr:helix-turn-helix domain-containing protein [Chryseobacterium sp. JV558]MDW9378696.1 helix-turn-helix domain-containing protein [Chryseobacterium sp. JV558]